MRFHTHQSGQSLIEILFAIALFLIGTITVGYLILDAQITLRTNIEFAEARLLAREGIDAVRTVRDRSFSDLAPGTYGLALQDNRWTLSLEPDVENIYTRTITISEIDADMRTIESRVAWGTSPQDHTVTFVTYLADWAQTGGFAGYLEVDQSAATLSASSTTLTGLSLSNASSGDDIVIVAMRAQWLGEPALADITIGELNIFTAASSSPTMSGDIVDTEDYLIPAGTGYVPVDAIVFDGELIDTDLLLTFIMDDDSERHVLIPL